MADAKQHSLEACDVNTVKIIASIWYNSYHGNLYAIVTISAECTQCCVSIFSYVPCAQEINGMNILAVVYLGYI